jgi:biotin carboxyl carrier protein
MGEERAKLFDQVAGFFERSRFEYLALYIGEASITLSRAPPADAGQALGVAEAATSVLSSSVGFVEAPVGRAAFAGAGERVSKGEVLFAVRRFAGIVPVIVPADGILTDVLVKPGEFVNFGQEIARLDIESTTEQA